MEKEIKEKIKLLCEICEDYRAGDGFEFDKEHVKKWIKQFPVEFHEPILIGLTEALENTYISKDKMVEFCNSVIKFFEDFFDKHDVEVLDIQLRGSSQKDLNDIFFDCLEDSDIDLNNPRQEKVYFYIDEAVFTGNHFVRDIENWLENECLDTPTVYLVTPIIYTKAIFFIRNKLSSKIKLEIIRATEFNNYKNYYYKELGVLWPTELSNEVAESFYEKLLEEAERNNKSSKINEIYRDEKFKIIDEQFDTAGVRQVIEEQFMIKGIEIINRERTPNYNKKPLGYSYNPEYGFGSILITYRNAPNNCPLVLWYGDPTADDYSPLSKWYPLFPRKTNRIMRSERLEW